MSGTPPLPTLTPAQEAETNLPRIMGVIATFHFLALSFVAVRLYTRFIVVKSPKIDDAFMIVATVSRILITISLYNCSILIAHPGLVRSILWHVMHHSASTSWAWET